jgi:hypothetical protein
MNCNKQHQKDTNQSVEDTRPTDAPNGASAGANAPAAFSSSGGNGKRSRGKRGGASSRKGWGGGGRDQGGSFPKEKHSVKPNDYLKFTAVLNEASASRAEKVMLKDIAIASAVEMRKMHGKFNMNVKRASAEKIAPGKFSATVFCAGNDIPDLISEFIMLVGKNVEKHNESVSVIESSAPTLPTTRRVVMASGGDTIASGEVAFASGGGATASGEQEGVISVPMRGPRDLWMCRVKLARGLATERGHPFVGLAISQCKKYGQNKWGKVIVSDVTDTHFTIKARQDVIGRFRATLLTRWVKFELRVEADIGACELAARKVGKHINALDKVRANIDTTGIKFVGRVAVVPCSVSLSAVDLFRDAFKTQIAEVPSAPRGDDRASKRVQFAQDKFPCNCAEESRYIYNAAVMVAKKWSKSGTRVRVFRYDGKPGSEICVTFSCEADAVEPFKTQVLEMVAFNDKRATERLKFEGCRVHRAYDSPWTKNALEYVTRSADVSFMFTGRVKIFEHAVTGETALAEELPADVSRGRVPRVGPAPLWIETMRCAFSEYVLRSDGEMLTDEEEDKMAADVRETLDYFERNTFSIPYFRGRGFEALQNRLSVQFETRSQKIKFQKGSLCGTSESHRDVLKIPSAKHVFVIAKRTGEGPFGRTVEFVCEAASDDAKIPNFVRSVRTELMRLWQQSCIARRIVRLSLPAARVRIEQRRECNKVRAEKMALRKEQMAESQAAASRIAKERSIVYERRSVGTGGAPAMEKTPAPEHDSGDEEDDAIDFAASNPFGALLVVEESSVAATKGGASVAATKGGAAMVEPEKMVPKKKAKSKKGITLAVDYGVVGSKGGRK